MASELRVNTLKDASGNNSVAMSLLQRVVQKRGIASDAAGTLTDDSFNSISYR